MLDDRKLAVLRAIITDYVENSEPVGSKALVERYRLDVSPATIRNDMATLEEEGIQRVPFVPETVADLHVPGSAHGRVARRLPHNRCLHRRPDQPSRPPVN